MREEISHFYVGRVLVGILAQRQLPRSSPPTNLSTKAKPSDSLSPPARAVAPDTAGRLVARFCRNTCRATPRSSSRTWAVAAAPSRTTTLPAK